LRGRPEQEFRRIDGLGRKQEERGGAKQRDGKKNDQDPAPLPCQRQKTCPGSGQRGAERQAHGEGIDRSEKEIDERPRTEEDAENKKHADVFHGQIECVWHCKGMMPASGPWRKPPAC